MKGTEVSIIGAGLVGSLLSIHLARRGMKVDLYERRPDMRREMVSAGRSINLAISTRGIHALKQVGLEEEALSQAIPMKGRMIHGRDGQLGFQRYGKDDSECIYSISRGGLNQTLMTAAEKTGAVTLHFKKKLTECDPTRQTLQIQDEGTGQTVEVRAEIVIGTDGSASALRKEIARQAGADCTESYLDYGYKELHIEPGSDGGFRMEKNALHIWPRGTFMLIALPNFDGSFTVTLFLPLEGAVSFESLKTPEDAERFFSSEFPDAIPLIPALKETFFANPTGRMVTVKCSPWNYGEWALLLGDAAHAIVPFFGQGMNSGFEDCTLLDQMIESRGKDWNFGFEDFAKARKPDADAIADLAVENFIEMRDKVGNKAFLLEKEVEKILEREFPGEYLSRYRLVTFHRVPYRTALHAGIVQSEILSELCTGLERADQVDLARAGELIRAKLAGLRVQTGSV